LVPLSIGAMLIGQVYAGGATSGANYNPAVSVALLLRTYLAGSGPACKRVKDTFSPHRCAAYVAVQILGALLAGIIARIVVDLDVTRIIGYPYPGRSNDNVIGALWAELCATFALVYVFLHSVTSSKTSGNGFFGIAIGSTLAAMVVAVGPLSGGALNLAVGLLGIISGTEGELGHVWIYWFACPLGGLLAALAFWLQCHSKFTGAEDGSQESQNCLHAKPDDGRKQFHIYHLCNGGAASDTGKSAWGNGAGVP